VRGARLCNQIERNCGKPLRLAFSRSMRGIASIRDFMRLWSPEAIANRKTPGALAPMAERMVTYRSVGG
jgi:hypothetical protein